MFLTSKGRKQAISPLYFNNELEPYLGENATIYQRICAYIIYIRDKNIVKLIERTMIDYSKVLIVYGSTHYMNQAHILECLYDQPSVSWHIE